MGGLACLYAQARLEVRSRVRLAWTTAFVVALLLPILLRTLSLERQSLGPELITITGLLATVLIVATVVLPSRLRSLTRALGIEAVLRHHRTLGLSAALFTLAHVAAVITNDPRGVGLFLPFMNLRASPQTVASVPLLSPLLTPPGRALFGVVATICLVLLGMLSGRHRGSWERWRTWHLVATVGVLVGTLLHVLLIGHLIPTPAVIDILLGDPLGWTILRSATQDPLAAAFLVILALTVLGVGAWRWLRRPVPFHVVSTRRVTPDVTSFVLRPIKHGFRRFRPGRFAWLRLTESPILSEEHPISLSSAVQDRPTIEFTVKHGGNWTTRLRHVGPGDIVYVDGPHGSFTPNMKSRRGLVLIAGGVGITPMMSILRTAAHDGATRSYRVIAVNRGQAPFHDELIRLMMDIDLQLFDVTREQVTAERLGAILPRAMRGQLEYYVCGSLPLVTQTVGVLEALEISSRRVHTELFG